MDVRNRDELLKKQETLEAYLLENPQSSLFAWYARQNMEAGELDRALSICKLGVPKVESRGVLHKLMGEIYLAKGEVTQSMKHMVECILTKEPFPGVILEVIKNLGETMEPQQVAFLIYLLNKALPGHPDAIQFYKKYPSSRNYIVQPGQYKFLEEMAANLERSALVEVMPIDDEDEPQLALPEAADEKPAWEMPAPEPVQAPESTSTPEAAPVSQAPPPAPEPVSVEPTPAPVAEATPPVPEYEIPDSTPPLNELVEQPLPEPAEPPKPKPKTIPRQGPAVKHNITRSMATFTLMQIFKDQGMFENALEVLQFLREKSSNVERIDAEEKEIRDLMARNGAR